MTRFRIDFVNTMAFHKINCTIRKNTEQEQEETNATSNSFSVNKYRINCPTIYETISKLNVATHRTRTENETGVAGSEEDL